MEKVLTKENKNLANTADFSSGKRCCHKLLVLVPVNTETGTKALFKKMQTDQASVILANRNHYQQN